VNISYEVFHLDSAKGEREGIALQVNDLMSAHYERLNSGTINFMENEDNYKNFLEENKYFRSNGEMKIGWLGVWASNYNAWKHLLQSNYDCVILFEDDCFLDQNGPIGIKNYLDSVPDDWDFFSPYVNHNMFENFNVVHDIQDENICRSYQDWSLACYVVSRQGAEKALEEIKNNGLQEPVDYFVFNKNVKRFNTYTVKPTANKYTRLAELHTTIQDVETRIKINGSI
jgi:GR25 family glycosyltransferase involved in LPS biosynthesis